ncbi:MAG: hypothetical protein MK312_00225, partial [Roseibacillus sp.]|nr:hypothetical protein [Roseibacillus sp.]
SDPDLVTGSPRARFNAISYDLDLGEGSKPVVILDIATRHCDLIVANDVSRKGVGVDSELNEGLLVYPGHTLPLPKDHKERLAHAILEAVDELRIRKG